MALATGSTAAEAREPESESSWSANDIHGAIYAMPIIAPEYTGSGDYTVRPFAGLHVSNGPYYIRSEGAGLVVNLSPLTNIIAGPAVNYRFGRDDDVENVSVAALGKIDGAWEAGGFVGLSFHNVLVEADQAEARAKVLFDLGDVHKGRVVELSLSYRAPVSDRITASISATAVHGDRKYMNTYFGVKTKASVPDLTPFAAKAGFQSVGATGTVNFRLSERWGLLAIGGYDRLLGSAKDSPSFAASARPTSSSAAWACNTPSNSDRSRWYHKGAPNEARGRAGWRRNANCRLRGSGTSNLAPSAERCQRQRDRGAAASRTAQRAHPAATPVPTLGRSQKSQRGRSAAMGKRQRGWPHKDPQRHPPVPDPMSAILGL
ncbi:MipA/OmpV family protein [Sphingobium sp. 3R8]|uniref:MipA/OmpV family protein n=1 Tax=Sphingobium sp. 3R8 TaxID=2874921 RepID=UPI001CCCF53B|nr:MipA/OmpV family protein [Sphingobium sp. 3R8]MBZ9650265.1 MipA/OmpV family protein [Sphingobium sp. 3R8]